MQRILFCCLLLSFGCSQKKDDRIPKKPNIIVLMTDQERYPTHWPEGWAEKNLPSTERLKQHGLTFHKAYTAAAQCSPSRAVIMTGEHFPTNRVALTFTTPLPSEKELVDIGAMLGQEGGYEVVWKGKWHLSSAVDGGDQWSQKDIAAMENTYGWSRWNPPDAGDAILEIEPVFQGKSIAGLSTLGGGFADNDGRYVSGASGNPKQTPGWGESVLDYLSKKAFSPEGKPFCLFISLVNPHDVWVYPGAYEAAGYKKEAFANLGISLPPNFDDDLTTKPSVQRLSRANYNKMSPLQSSAQENEYVNFYAYLHTVVDQHIGKILDHLDKLGLTEDTVIIRTADHGELGLSHGMREKAYTVYEEMIHIPFIVSNPKMYPAPQETQAFYCHLDLMPTLAELAGISSGAYKGVSMVPVFKDPTASVQDSVLFTFDDAFFLPLDTPSSHIRAIREGDWTYAVYYSADGTHYEYEMYNLKTDPGQLINLLHGSPAQEVSKEAQRLHDKLKAKLVETETLPPHFPAAIFKKL
jgi:arylsulfatase A-like enzyme